MDILPTPYALICVRINKPGAPLFVFGRFSETFPPPVSHSRLVKSTPTEWGPKGITMFDAFIGFAAIGMLLVFVWLVLD